MSVSMGLVDPDDIFLSEWNASILGPHGVSFSLHENIYNNVFTKLMI